MSNSIVTETVSPSASFPATVPRTDPRILRPFPAAATCSSSRSCPVPAKTRRPAAEAADAGSSSSRRSSGKVPVRPGGTTSVV